MLVKMKVKTRFLGHSVAPGDEFDVDSKVANRWAEKGIAEIIDGGKKEKSPEEMTAKELYALCIEKGFDVEEKQKKEVYLTALAEADNDNEDNIEE